MLVVLQVRFRGYKLSFPCLIYLRLCTATFGATLRFVVKDCDPNTGEPDSEDGYDDEYMLEDMEITLADQIQKTKKSNFQAVWDAADTEGKFCPDI